MLAKIQQQIQDKGPGKQSRFVGSTKVQNATSMRPDQGKATSNFQLSKERQLRDFWRAHNLCYYYKAPYDPAHAAQCSKRPKNHAQVNALVVNGLDTTLTKEILEQLKIEDALTEEFGTLSLNAIAGTECGEAMRLRALVGNKMMLMLVDSSSSHTFVSRHFLEIAGI